MQPTTSTATAVSAALATQAESVCRHYLPNGRREGRYRVVGDVNGTRGKSLFIRLRGPRRPAKWTNAATSNHSGLLDIIRHRSGNTSKCRSLTTARSFLALSPQPAARKEAGKRLSGDRACFGRPPAHR